MAPRPSQSIKANKMTTTKPTKSAMRPSKGPSKVVPSATSTSTASGERGSSEVKQQLNKDNSSYIHENGDGTSVAGESVWSTGTVATAPPEVAEEYTDYSCSTFVERLARDVETLLRKWHVDRGSDRHVSIHGHHHHSSTTTTTTPHQPQQQSPPSGPPLAAASASNSVSGSTPSARPTAGVHAAPNSSLSSTVSLIRSEQFTWLVSFHQAPTGTRLSWPVELELALWDGPTAHTPESSNNDEDDDGKGANSSPSDELVVAPSQTPERDLPYSLQRRETDVMPLDPFANFSTLFGIGQHITLSPVWSMSPSPPKKTMSSSSTASAHSREGPSPSPWMLPPPDVMKALASSILTRHEATHTAPEMVAYMMTTWLQTALNVAATSCQCCLPVLGIWGEYRPSHLDEPLAVSPFGYHDHHHHKKKEDTGSMSSMTMPLPRWLRQSAMCPDWRRAVEAELEKVRSAGRGARRRPSLRLLALPRSLSSSSSLNDQWVPPLLTGQLLSEDCRATFWLSALGSDQQWTRPTTSSSSSPATTRSLSDWGTLLLQHSRCRHRRHHGRGGDEHEDTVHLWGARHVYVWSKYRDSSHTSSPRGLLASLQYPPSTLSQHAWRDGPHIEQQEDEQLHEAHIEHPVLLEPDSKDILPQVEDDLETYRRQCRIYALSLIESMSGATSSEPLWGPPEDPVEFLQASVSWHGVADADTGHMQPLIELPLKTRSRHSLSKEDKEEMEAFVEKTLLDPYKPSSFSINVHFDREMDQAPLAATLRCVLAALIRTATLPRETLISHLIDESVMARWDHVAGNHIAMTLADMAKVDSAVRALVAAMDWSHAADDMIERWQAEDRIRKVFDGSLSIGFPSPPDQAAPDASPLLDEMFVPFPRSASPGRLPCLLFVSMASVRSPSSMALMWSAFVRELRRRWDSREGLPNMKFVPGLDPFPDVASSKRCVSSVGIKTNFSAHIYSTEPDPDDFHCLVGQKLQLFNLCVENVVAMELRYMERIERRPRAEEKKHFKAGNSKTHHSTMFVDGLTGNEEPVKGTTKNPEFFDASDSGSVRSLGQAALMINFHNSADAARRSGARCPVVGASLIGNGDQVYAPYLQRPYPLTDDIIAQRRMMLSRQKGDKVSASIRHRIEITHRLQKPKLLSDMEAFRAANPGSAFDDFIRWYGNPSNPIEDYGETEVQGLTFQPGVATADPITTKLDRAAEAIRVLDETRNFWTRTWDEAKPVCAEEQEPLFDAANAVEMAIDHLDTIHPASLLCQVMSVNLASAYFALATSCREAIRVRVVRDCLSRCRYLVKETIEQLSQDVLRFIVVQQYNEAPAKNPIQSSVATLETLALCGRVCLALSEAEILVSRSVSLLSKLPEQVDIINSILANSIHGKQVIVEKDVDQIAVLETIGKYQHVRPSSGHPPSPYTREYMLRNKNNEEPSQLCVRYKSPGMCETSDLLLALTESRRELS